MAGYGWLNISEIKNESVSAFLNSHELFGRSYIVQLFCADNVHYDDDPMAIGWMLRKEADRRGIQTRLVRELVPGDKFPIKASDGRANGLAEVISVSRNTTEEIAVLTRRPFLDGKMIQETVFTNVYSRQRVWL